MKKLIRLIRGARIVYVCGNGGSAATAEHLVNDLFSRGIRAICLSSNTSIMTMIANDFGYGFTFSQQLKVFGGYQDLLITISCSGESDNVLNAITVAQLKDMPVYEFEKFKGKDRDYEALEDRHLQMVHKIKKLL